MTESTTSAGRQLDRTTLCWALLLYFGLWLVGELTAWASFEFFGAVLFVTSSTEGIAPVAFRLIPALLLLATLPYVGRQQHQVLWHLWIYFIVVTIFWQLSDYALVNTMIWSLSDYPPDPLTIEPAAMEVWANRAIYLSPWILLVWFARRVSTRSFHYAVLFIGLVAAMGSPGSVVAQLYGWEGVHTPPNAVFLVMMVGKIAVGIVAVWTLLNIELLVATFLRLIGLVAFLVLLPMALVALAIAYPDVTSDLSMLPSPWVHFVDIGSKYGVVIIVAYFLRIRNSDGAHVPDGSAVEPGTASTTG